MVRGDGRQESYLCLHKTLRPYASIQFMKSSQKFVDISDGNHDRGQRYREGGFSDRCMEGRREGGEGDE